MTYTLPAHFHIDHTGAATADATVIHGDARFTVLTNRLIRCEYGQQEDRPTQHIWYRQLDVPSFSVSTDDGVLCIQTDALTLTYTGGVFTSESLQVTGNGCDWNFGKEASGNLKGAARTLDNCDGDWDYVKGQHITIHDGLLSRDGWSVVDDSDSLIFSDDGNLFTRDQQGTDFYLFAYGQSYKECLADYYRIAGSVPLIPRWALGLWWSKWERYTQDDLTQIVGEFSDNGVPLSVCVIDMDWHLDGWTGYTWNPECFPQPKEFLSFLHKNGTHACMNLHPASGVAKHEAAYPAMAEHMGVDPSTGETIPFAIDDPQYMDGYFKHLHHPLEKDGVDFWWMDWQQGEASSTPGLDPLWYLNHLHATDLTRDESKRPFVFSRWGGWGSHRYPIGFSGDAARTWTSLSHEVQFTAQSANAAYGWWSHDIGGFSNGFDDDELLVRWIQFGAFSPIFRLHNCGDPALDYRPWSKNSEIKDAALSAMSLRRQLIPYIYTAAHAHSTGDVPLCTAMYIHHPEQDEAYRCPQQYYFGPDIIAAPFTQAADVNSKLSRQVVWLPEGSWYHLHNGRAYSAGWHAIHDNLSAIPSFVRAGTMLPMDTSATAEPNIEWLCFPGTGQGAYYSDDGESSAAGTRYTSQQKWTETSCRITLPQLPQQSVRIRGLATASITCSLPHRWEENGDLCIQIGTETEITITFATTVANRDWFTEKDLWDMLLGGRVNSHLCRQMQYQAEDKQFSFIEDCQLLAPYLVDIPQSLTQAIVETWLDCGFASYPLPDKTQHVVWWNNRKRDDFSVRMSLCEWLVYTDTFECGPTEAHSETLTYRQSSRGWSAQVNYANLTTVVHDHRRLSPGNERHR